MIALSSEATLSVIYKRFHKIYRVNYIIFRKTLCLLQIAMLPEWPFCFKSALNSQRCRREHPIRGQFLVGLAVLKRNHPHTGLLHIPPKINVGPQIQLSHHLGYFYYIQFGVRCKFKTVFLKRFCFFDTGIDQRLICNSI